MENADIVATILFGLLALYWAVLIGSSLWACAVRYVTEGDKKPSTFLTFMKGVYGGYDEDDALVCSVLLTVVYFALSGVIVALVHHGHGTALLVIISTVASTWALLRISKAIYSIGKKLNAHVDNKELHK